MGCEINYGNVICKLSKIVFFFFYHIIYNNYLKCTIYELNMELFHRQKLVIMHCGVLFKKAHKFQEIIIIKY